MYVATIGGFDGVHIGHQFVLDKMSEIATARKLSTIVFGFSGETFWQGRRVDLLSTDFQRKTDVLARKIDRFEWVEFDKIKDLTAKDFLVKIQLHYKISIWIYTKKLYIGKDHLSFDKLQKEVLGVDFIELPLQIGLKNSPYSSTNIRNFLRKGEVGKAQLCLGRPYEIRGNVTKGAGQGKKIGFPTLNITNIPTLVPGDGVYITLCTLIKKDNGPSNCYASMTFIGNTQTKNQESGRMIETHLLNFVDLGYDLEVSLKFLTFLRSVEVVHNLDDLKVLLKKDSEAVSQFFLSKFGIV